MAVLLIATHAAAVAAIWVSALPIGVHIALKLAVVVSLWISLRQAGWLNAPRFVTALRIRTVLMPGSSGAPREGDRAEIRYRDGTVQSGQVGTGNVVLPWFI